MTAVIRMQLPKDTLDMSETTALVYSRDSTIFTGWKLTEPELRRQFEGADFAYFEAEATEAGDLRIVKRLPDQGWTGDVLIRRMRDPE